MYIGDIVHILMYYDSKVIFLHGGAVGRSCQGCGSATGARPVTA